MKRFLVSQMLLAFLMFGGCSHGPRVAYGHLTYSELIEQSPIVVVGLVEHKETYWKERKRQGSENGLPIFWYHVEVRIEVENMLRGDLSASPVDYTYWVPAGAKSGEWNSPREGARYVHFLRREGAELRSVVDFWPSSIRVTTGRHGTLDQAGGLPQAIARLLLQPGEDFDAERFDIIQALGHASLLVGEPAALALVQRSDPRIRTQACEVFKGRPEADRLCGE